MTPEELYTAMDARRREAGLVWWQVAVELDTCAETLRVVRDGLLSQRLRERIEAWLGGAGV